MIASGNQETLQSLPKSSLTQLVLVLAKSKPTMSEQALLNK